METTLITAFMKQFGESPTVVVRAPGRVNLIGEHTDYNDGFVLPMAIDRAVWLALRPRTDTYVVVYSLEFATSGRFDLNSLERGKMGWLEYIKGVAFALQEANYPLSGWEGVMSGDVPVGAGLSSSAAVEMAVARAFQAVSGWPWDAAAMALVGQKAENSWVGVNTGIMDQMISAAGQAGTAMLLDCRSLAAEFVPLPPGTAVIVLDTATRRGLVDSAYNERRAQCAAAAAFFQVPALRDVTLAQFQAQADKLDELTRQRARHVITENERTVAAAAAMRAGNAVQLGQLMNASHQSLRHDFAVSSEALDTIVACAREHEACLGARMTGAGFGGCAVALVESAAATSFITHVTHRYQAQTGLTPNLYLCSPSRGAEIWGV
ncbi:MAG: galactokinase [Anaerolineae bacterium]|nr:galactokinase [Anaerolineae bacterium]